MHKEEEDLVGEFDKVCQVYHKKTAIVTPHDGQSYSYEKLNGLVAALRTNVLKQYPVGSSVAIIISNGVEYVVAFLAIISAGLIAAPHNPAATEEEFEFFLQDIEASLVLTVGESVDPKIVALTTRLNINLVSINVHDGGNPEANIITGSNTPPPCLLNCPPGTALLLHTSGTTAKPKLVPIRGASLLNSSRQLIKAYSLTSTDTLLLVMPLFHVHGLIGNLLTCLLSGGTAVIPPKFSASHFMELAAMYRATWFSAVPTIYQILLTNKDQYLREDLLRSVQDNLSFIRSCSAGISSALLRRLEQTFRVPVVQAYGMTESTHLCASGIPGDRGLPLGSVGKPIDRQVKIHQADAEGKGEICLRGPGVMEKYVRPESANATAFTKDGYFRTGDVGYMDREGYLFVQGRIKELINRGGEKINPHEVENVLLLSGSVKEAVCFSLPDPIYGEQVASVLVVPTDINRDDMRSELVELCHQHLSTFKCPTRFFFVEEIPKSAIGKIQRAYLSRYYSAVASQ